MISVNLNDYAEVYVALVQYTLLSVIAFLIMISISSAFI